MRKNRSQCLPNYVERFKTAVKQWEKENPTKQLLELSFFAPTPQEDIEETRKVLKERHKIDMPAGIENFYKQTNGLRFRWIDKNDYDYDAKKATDDIREQHGYMTYGLAAQADYGTFGTAQKIVIIPSIRETFINKMSSYIHQLKSTTHFELIKEFGFTYKSRKQYDDHIYLFNIYSFFSAHALAFGTSGRKEPKVILADDHHCAFYDMYGHSFDKYLERLIPKVKDEEIRKSTSSTPWTKTYTFIIEEKK